MAIRNTTVLCGLFFMAIGSVYSGSAIGADEPAPVDQAPQAEMAPPADELNDELDADALGEDATEPELPEGQQVEVGSFGQIDLHVKDLELAKVLQLLSIQSRRNIVASRQVSGTVSADLYDVGFYEALDAILHTNGFGYREKGNFIYVYTQEEIAQMEQAQRQKTTKVLRLNYITAQDARAFVMPLLSESGSIQETDRPTQGMQPSLSDGGANTYAHSEMLVLHDYPEHIEQITAVLKELDERPKQVQIEATILQARLTEENAFGVDFAIFGKLGVDDFTSPLGSVDDLISGTGRGDQTFTQGQSAQVTVGQTGESGPSAKIGVLGNDAAVFIRALDSVTDTTILARPQMLVLNRQRAELLVGREIGYLSTTQTDVTATQDVEFLNVGTELRVRPFISDDGFVRLELRPEVSEGQTEVVDGTRIPDKTTQHLTTNVMVRSGQTVVLGGLFKEDTVSGRRQVPGLGDVPLIGRAFRGRNDDVRRDEVIFLIKPTIIKDEALYAEAERAEETVGLARVGAREGLLPWSRTKLTGSHLRRAHQHKREGDVAKALWHTNMTLHLHPSNVEALRLKEQITGESMMIQDESVLKDAVDAAVTEVAPEDEQLEHDPRHDAMDESADEPAADAVDDASDQPADDADTEAEADADAEVDVDAETESSRPAESDADMEAAMQAILQAETAEEEESYEQRGVQADDLAAAEAAATDADDQDAPADSDE